MRVLIVFLLATGFALAQTPRVGLVELYGVRKVSQEHVRSAVGVHPGDPLSISRADIEERLEKISGVLRARVQAVCCAADGQAVLYVGIEERDTPHVEFRPAPAGNANLPATLVATYRDFESYNPTGPAAEAYRDTFERLAKDHSQSLHHTLRESDDAGQRAIAAFVRGYGPVSRSTVDDLQYAMLDPDQTVRANAMRALEDMAARAAKDPDLGVRVELTWFVELLNSLVWDDRFRAAAALEHLTSTRDPGILTTLHERALASLIDMARWKTPAHAHPAFVLLGRIGGLSEKDIEAAWARGDREAVIKKALKEKPAAED